MRWDQRRVLFFFFFFFFFEQDCAAVVRNRIRAQQWAAEGEDHRRRGPLHAPQRPRRIMAKLHSEVLNSTFTKLRALRRPDDSRQAASVSLSILRKSTRAKTQGLHWNISHSHTQAAAASALQVCS